MSEALCHSPGGAPGHWELCLLRILEVGQYPGVVSGLSGRTLKRCAHPGPHKQASQGLAGGSTRTRDPPVSEAAQPGPHFVAQPGACRTLLASNLAAPGRQPEPGWQSSSRVQLSSVAPSPSVPWLQHLISYPLCGQHSQYTGQGRAMKRLDRDGVWALTPTPLCSLFSTIINLPGLPTGSRGQLRRAPRGLSMTWALAHL